ncbi:CAP domain-containing protein [Acetobacteraceae bacterium]|nr:CAP domain-containing protein [Candidatus Parcubacteria bacterium]
MKALFLSFLVLIASALGWISQQSPSAVIEYTATTSPVAAVVPIASPTASISTNVTTKEPVPATIQPKTEVSAAVAAAPAPKKTPASESTSAPAKTADDYATEIAADVFAQTNTERVKNGLPALVYDSKLSLVARAHSSDMLAANYFSHTNKSDCDSACRVKNANYSYSYVGENIFMAKGFTLSGGDTASLIVQGWMGSPGHRANILQTAFTNSGVGVAFEGTRIYITAIYSKPR